MKGVSFQKPWEFRLVAEGEAWQQGGSVMGRLEAKSMVGGGEKLDAPRVCLALGELKKVQKKDPEAFEILQEEKLSGLGPWDWTFALARTAPVTDNLTSLFLLYGQNEDLSKLGQLQLKVEPTDPIREFLDTFSTQFRFVLKNRKMKKDWLEAKLAPPDSRSFAMLDQLLLNLRDTGEALELRYSFVVKKVDASSPSLAVQKAKRELEQSLTPIQYRLASGRFNHEAFERVIRDALDTVESKVAF